MSTMKKSNLERRRRIAIEKANQITSPFKDLKEGRLLRSKSHLRLQVAKRMFELLSVKRWKYEGTNYEVVRITPVLQASSKYALQVELRDEDGQTERVLLQKLLQHQT